MARRFTFTTLFLCFLFISSLPRVNSFELAPVEEIPGPIPVSCQGDLFLTADLKSLDPILPEDLNTCVGEVQIGSIWERVEALSDHRVACTPGHPAAVAWRRSWG